MRQSHERMHDHNKKFGEQLTEWLKDTSDSKKQLDREYQRGREDMRREVLAWAGERAIRCAACFGHKDVPHNHGQNDIADLITHLTQPNNPKQYE